MKKMLIGAVLFAVTSLSATAFAAPCTGNEPRGTTCHNTTTLTPQTSCGNGTYLPGGDRSAETLDDNCGGQGTVRPVGAGRVINQDTANTKTETSKEQTKSK